MKSYNNWIRLVSRENCSSWSAKPWNFKRPSQTGKIKLRTVNSQRFLRTSEFSTCGGVILTKELSQSEFPFASTISHGLSLNGCHPHLQAFLRSKSKICYFQALYGKYSKMCKKCFFLRNFKKIGPRGHPSRVSCTCTQLCSLRLTCLNGLHPI